MQRTGRVTVKVNGSQLRSMPGATLQIGGIQRDAEATDQGEPLFAEKYVVATVGAEMPHCADTDLEAFRNLSDGTLTYVCDTGTVFTIANVFVTTIDELANGKVKVNFAGRAAKQG